MLLALLFVALIASTVAPVFALYTLTPASR